MHIKTAKTKFPVLQPVAGRWSPRSFDAKEVSAESLQSLFEAARWSASAMNEQPWRFILGLKGNAGWERLFDCLDEWNQKWAYTAPVLLLAIGHQRYTSGNKPNAYAAYDTGQAVSTMCIQASSMGLLLHQMGGFSVARAIETFALPEDYTPLTMIALGYPGDPEQLPEPYRSRDLTARERNDFTSFVFEDTFGNPSSLF